MKTRNGTPFRLYASDGIAPHVRHGAVLRPEGWLAFEWTLEGFVNDDRTPHDYDIDEFMGAFNSAVQKIFDQAVN